MTPGSASSAVFPLKAAVMGPGKDKDKEAVDPVMQAVRGKEVAVDPVRGRSKEVEEVDPVRGRSKEVEEVDLVGSSELSKQSNCASNVSAHYKLYYHIMHVST